MAKAEGTELERLHVLRKNNQEANAITRECIETALVKLMEKKPYDAITITDITKRAGVSRTAYYRNYASKDEILSRRIRTIRARLSDVMRKYNAVTQTRETWLALLGAVAEVGHEYRLLLDAGFGEKLILEYAAVMNEGVPEDDVELRLSNTYWAGAIAAVVADWVRGGMSVPAGRVADIGANLMQKGIRTVADYGNGC